MNTTVSDFLEDTEKNHIEKNEEIFAMAHSYMVYYGIFMLSAFLFIMLGYSLFFAIKKSSPKVISSLKLKKIKKTNYERFDV